MSLQHRTGEELAAYVMEDAAPDEKVDIEEHLRGCAGCRATSSRLRVVTGVLVDVPWAEEPRRELEAEVFELIRLEPVVRLASLAVVDPPPPADLEERALANVVPSEVVVVQPDRWSRVSKVLAPVMAAAAIGLGVLVLDLSRDSGGDITDPRVPRGHLMQSVALSGTEAEAEIELVHFRHDNYRLELHADDLPIPPSGSRYEVWLTGPDGYVSAGSFRLVRPDDIVLEFLVGIDPKEYGRVEVTLEDADGDPSKSDRVVLTGRIDPAHVDH